MAKNPIAKSLRSAHLKLQIVKPKKGKGAYSRRERMPGSFRKSLELPNYAGF